MLRADDQSKPSVTSFQETMRKRAANKFMLSGRSVSFTPGKTLDSPECEAGASGSIIIMQPIRICPQPITQPSQGSTIHSPAACQVLPSQEKGSQISAGMKRMGISDESKSAMHSAGLCPRPRRREVRIVVASCPSQKGSSCSPRSAEGEKTMFDLALAVELSIIIELPRGDSKCQAVKALHGC